MSQVNFSNLTEKQIQAIATFVVAEGNKVTVDSSSANRTYTSLVKRNIIFCSINDANSSQYKLTSEANYLIFQMHKANQLVGKLAPIAKARDKMLTRKSNTGVTMRYQSRRLNYDALRKVHIAYFNATQPSNSCVDNFNGFDNLLIDAAIEYCSIVLGVKNQISSRFNGKHNELWLMVEGINDSALADATRVYMSAFEPQE